MIRVLLVDDVAHVRQFVRESLSVATDIEIVGEASNGEEAVEAVRRLRPGVVIMDYKMPVMDGITATEAIYTEFPTIGVIMLSIHDDRETIHKAMRAGAKDFLTKPSDRDELISAIRRVAVEEAPRHTTTTVAGRQRGKVILVAAGKGGIGKTSLACNLAVMLAHEKHARVALMDLDTQFGDVGIMLNLAYTHNISDIFSSQEELDDELVLETLVDGPGGIKVMLAPVDSTMAELVTPTLVKNLTERMINLFDFVVADCGAHFSEASLEGLEQADKIVVLTSTTVVSIKDARQTLGVMESLNVEPSKLALVVNKTVGHTNFSKQAIEESLKTPVTQELPYDPVLVEGAMSSGKPFVLTHPNAGLTKAVRELSNKLVPEGFVPAGRPAEVVKATPKKGGLLGRIGKK